MSLRLVFSKCSELLKPSQVFTLYWSPDIFFSKSFSPQAHPKGGQRAVKTSPVPNPPSSLRRAVQDYPELPSPQTTRSHRLQSHFSIPCLLLNVQHCGQI